MRRFAEARAVCIAVAGSRNAVWPELPASGTIAADNSPRAFRVEIDTDPVQPDASRRERHSFVFRGRSSRQRRAGLIAMMDVDGAR